MWSTSTVFATLIAASTSSLVQASVLSARALTLPPVNGQADYQLGGPYAPDANVTIVTRDRTASPVAGIYSICYINAFQTQAEDEDWWKSESNLD